MRLTQAGDSYVESETNDKEFFDRLLLVLGGLTAAAVAVYFIAGQIASGTQHFWQSEEPLASARAGERIGPVGQVAIAGQTQPKPAVVAEPVVKLAQTGEQVYNSGCNVCHNAGVAGAPRLGDADNSRPRGHGQPGRKHRAAPHSPRSQYIPCPAGGRR